jgi:hypothetical protein
VRRTRTWRGIGCRPKRAHSRGMIQHDLAPVPANAWQIADQLDRAVAAYLTRFTGTSRDHARSDLRCFLSWCGERQLHPLSARRLHLELYLRWMQEVRRFKPSTVSRRFSVIAGFYRTAVIDGLLNHSPAEHVRRPTVPPEPRIGAGAARRRSRPAPGWGELVLIAGGQVPVAGSVDRVAALGSPDRAPCREPQARPALAGHRRPAAAETPASPSSPGARVPARRGDARSPRPDRTAR